MSIPKFTELIKESSDESTQGVLAGKNTFKSFLKVLTALGLKESNPDWNNTPEDFLIYYQYKDIQCNTFKSLAARFSSLTTFAEKIDNNDNECHLYCGIKTNLIFEYGVISKTKIVIGSTKVNKSFINWLLSLDSPSATSLKREIVNIGTDKLSLFCSIKKEMKEFNPGQTEERKKPTIKENIITFAYYGIGKWDNGKMSDEDINSIKDKFRTWLSKFKWCQKLQINVYSDKFWLYLSLKVK